MYKRQVFALCAKEDITGTDGKVILEADTVSEEQATDKEGKLTFTADLPIGFAYYIKETSPAPGFATTDETQEFTFEDVYKRQGNIKAYLLTALYNAPATIHSYYQAEVNHDMYGG